MMDYYMKVAESGLLGVLLVISFGVIAILYRRVEKLSDLRVSDAKESRDLLIEPIKGIQKTVDLILNQIGDTRNK